MAYGNESPTMNRKAGKITSENHIPSTPRFTCFNPSGISVSDQKSLTKIIRTIVMALKISMDEMR